MTIIDYDFKTERLQIKPWHCYQEHEFSAHGLAKIVQKILTPAVTAPLPPDWQGHYNVERAQQWIDTRDQEGINLLVVDSTSMNAVGIIILFDMNEGGENAELRLGYLLAESAWGKGFGSELVKGLVSFCQRQPVAAITAGVAKDNLASKKILEKSGFICDPDTLNDLEQIYRLQYSSNLDCNQ